jgi:hypothetical protein
MTLNEPVQHVVPLSLVRQGEVPLALWKIQVRQPRVPGACLSFEMGKVVVGGWGQAWWIEGQAG